MTVTEKWKDRKCDVARKYFYLLLIIIFIGFDCCVAGFLACWLTMLLNTAAESCNLDLCELSCAKMIPYGGSSAVECAHIGCNADCAGRPTVTFFSASCFLWLTSMNHTHMSQQNCADGLIPVTVIVRSSHIQCVRDFSFANNNNNNSSWKTKWDKLRWTSMPTSHAREPFRAWFNTLCAALIHAECIIMQSLTHKLKSLRPNE